VYCRHKHGRLDLASRTAAVGVDADEPLLLALAAFWRNRQPLGAAAPVARIHFDAYRLRENGLVRHATHSCSLEQRILLYSLLEGVHHDFSTTV
jgi:hypothetical protein